MTKSEVLKQVYNLPVNGNFNHDSGWSYNKFKSFVEEKFKENPEKQSIIMEIELPDGWWALKIEKIKNGLWDYFIPDTKEENEMVLRE